jgi:hypothetical protein
MVVPSKFSPGTTHDRFTGGISPQSGVRNIEELYINFLLLPGVTSVVHVFPKRKMWKCQRRQEAGLQDPESKSSPPVIWRSQMKAWVYKPGLPWLVCWMLTVGSKKARTHVHVCARALGCVRVFVRARARAGVCESEWEREGERCIWKGETSFKDSFSFG